MKTSDLQTFLNAVQREKASFQTQETEILHNIRVENEELPINLKIRPSSKLVVFFPGFHAADKPKPKFQRRNYFNHLECNCLSLFDPTLFLGEDVGLGWFQAGQDIPHFKRAEIFIAELSQALGIAAQDVLLFGTSAGGFSALKTSEGLPECSVFVGNPQTDVRKYYKSHVGRLSTALANTTYPTRLEQEASCVVGTPTQAHVVYAQNIQDSFHLNGHMTPFQAARPDMSYILYDHPSGHSPIGMQTELEVIKAMLNGQDPALCYQEFLVDTPRPQDS